MTSLAPISTSPALSSVLPQDRSAPVPPAVNATSEAFQAFVGETFYGLLLKSLRSTSKDVAYLDGGQAEDMFRQQLDQIVSERLAESHARDLSEPLYEQFQKRLNEDGQLAIQA